MALKIFAAKKEMDKRIAEQIEIIEERGNVWMPVPPEDGAFDHEYRIRGDGGWDEYLQEFYENLERNGKWDEYKAMEPDKKYIIKAIKFGYKHNYTVSSTLNAVYSKLREELDFESKKDLNLLLKEVFEMPVEIWQKNGYKDGYDAELNKVRDFKKKSSAGKEEIKVIVNQKYPKYFFKDKYEKKFASTLEVFLDMIDDIIERNTYNKNDYLEYCSKYLLRQFFKDIWRNPTKKDKLNNKKILGTILKKTVKSGLGKNWGLDYLFNERLELTHKLENYSNNRFGGDESKELAKTDKSCCSYYTEMIRHYENNKKNDDILKEYNNIPDEVNTFKQFLKKVDSYDYISTRIEKEIEKAVGRKAGAKLVGGLALTAGILAAIALTGGLAGAPALLGAVMWAGGFTGLGVSINVAAAAEEGESEKKKGEEATAIYDNVETSGEDAKKIMANRGGANIIKDAQNTVVENIQENKIVPKTLKGGGLFSKKPSGPVNQQIGDNSDGSAYFDKIAFILGSKKDSTPVKDDEGEKINEGMDGLLILNALEFDEDGISLPMQFQSNNLIIDAMKEVNRLREEVGAPYITINFQSPDVKTSEMNEAITKSRVLFEQLNSDKGISKFEKGLKEVQKQLQKENLKKLRFGNEPKTPDLDQLKSILTEEKELNENQNKFKKAFLDVKELFITKNSTTKKILIDAYKENVNTLIEKLEVIKSGKTSYKSFADRVKRNKTEEKKEAEKRLAEGKDLQNQLNNIHRKYNNYKEGSYKAPQSGGVWNPAAANRRRLQRNKDAKVKKEQDAKNLERDKKEEIKNMDGSQLFRMLIAYLEEDEKNKLNEDANRHLRDKSLDPEALARGYDDFEISDIMVDIDPKNPVMSKLRSIGNEKGITEIIMCYGDDKESGCWVYPPKKFKSFSDVVKSNKPISIKFTPPTSQKKKEDYKNLMTRKAEKKGLELKDLYKLNYTNTSGKKINGPKGGINPDKIEILHPKYLKILNIDCLYSDGIDPNETVRLYLFDKYDSDDFEDTRHDDVVRIMVEQPKTKTITIDEIKQNLTYVIQNNVILPNKVDVLFSYKELAISQGKTDISNLMKNLKHIYKYTCIYSIPDSHQLKHMIFKTNQDEWDEFYNDAKVTSQALEIDKRKLDKIFVFVVNSSGSNNTLRLNEKYGTIFYNFSELKEKIPVIDANIKNINKVLLNKFNDYWGNAKNSSNIFSLKFEGQNSGVYVLTIKKLDDLIKGIKFEQSVEKEIDDKEEKEKAELEAQDKEDEKIDTLLDKQEKDLEKEADKTKKILESEEGDENAERENSKKDEDEAGQLADESLAVKIDKEKNEAKNEVGKAEKKKTNLMESVKKGSKKEEDNKREEANAEKDVKKAEKDVKKAEEEVKEAEEKVKEAEARQNQQVEKEIKEFFEKKEMEKLEEIKNKYFKYQNEEKIQKVKDELVTEMINTIIGDDDDAKNDDAKNDDAKKDDAKNQFARMKKRDIKEIFNNFVKSKLDDESEEYDLVKIIQEKIKPNSPTADFLKKIRGKKEKKFSAKKDALLKEFNEQVNQIGFEQKTIKSKFQKIYDNALSTLNNDNYINKIFNYAMTDEYKEMKELKDKQDKSDEITQKALKSQRQQLKQTGMTEEKIKKELDKNMLTSKETTELGDLMLKNLANIILFNMHNIDHNDMGNVNFSIKNQTNNRLDELEIELKQYKNVKKMQDKDKLISEYEAKIILEKFYIALCEKHFPGEKVLVLLKKQDSDDSDDSDDEEEKLLTARKDMKDYLYDKVNLENLDINEQAKKNKIINYYIGVDNEIVDNDSENYKKYKINLTKKSEDLFEELLTKTGKSKSLFEKQILYNLKILWEGKKKKEIDKKWKKFINEINEVKKEKVKDKDGIERDVIILEDVDFNLFEKIFDPVFDWTKQKKKSIPPPPSTPPPATFDTITTGKKKKPRPIPPPNLGLKGGGEDKKFSKQTLKLVAKGGKRRKKKQTKKKNKKKKQIKKKKQTKKKTR